MSAFGWCLSWCFSAIRVEDVAHHVNPENNAAGSTIVVDEIRLIRAVCDLDVAHEVRQSKRQRQHWRPVELQRMTAAQAVLWLIPLLA
jgi:hypothetical protein